MLLCQSITLSKASLSTRSTRSFDSTCQKTSRRFFSSQRRGLRHIAVQASNTNLEETKRKKELVDKIESSMKASGMTSDNAKQVLKLWQNEVGTKITPDELRRVLVGQSNRALTLVLISTVFDAGAAFGAFNFGNAVSLATEQYGTPAIIGSALLFLLAGYYATGAVFDLFKLGAVLVARQNFATNSGAFLEAVEDIAGGATGLAIADKAKQAVNSVKVLDALSKMADLLKTQANGTGNTSAAADSDMLSDLGAFLTLSRAQQSYGFDATEFGLTDEEAATIAIIFGRFDVDDDGVLSEDEFRKLCSQYAAELNTPEEVKAAFEQIDTNNDGSIQFTEFVKFWTKQV
jgi:hypothetical protein